MGKENEKFEGLSIKVPDENKCACFYCKNGLWGAGDSSCLKYKVKPSGVLYDNKKCPMYEGLKEKLFKAFKKK